MKYIFLHFIFLFIHSISKCSCGWFINYTKNIQSSNLTSIFRCLSLRIIKIRWYSDNSILYWNGVVLEPSAFSITLACLPSITATQEKVVPRSIPITAPFTPSDLLKIKMNLKSSISSTVGFKKAFTKREIGIHSRVGFKIGVIMKLICDRNLSRCTIAKISAKLNRKRGVSSLTCNDATPVKTRNTRTPRASHGASISTTRQWISALQTKRVLTNNVCIRNEMEIIMNSSFSLHENGSFRIKALGCIHCNLSPLRHKICAIVLFRISSNCFIVNEPGVFPFSYQYLSPVLKINRILNVLFQVDYSDKFILCRIHNKEKIIYIYLNEYFGTFALINKGMLVQVQNQKLVLLKVLQLPNLYPLHFYKLYKQKYIIRIIKFLDLLKTFSRSFEINNYCKI
ncbi:hypothetical protein ALC53_02598 [Atta colombica]|uniref:Uncharacterized protein n=1 Tax=Atta colombica TaxID=520822 RepID=A0A195BQG4_9HYME|nr:hypothetical protein ALC53_02598 [Atta colombica]